MPVCVAQTVPKWTGRGATVCHDGYLVSAILPPHTPSCTASRHVPLGEPQNDMLVGELERRHGVVTCRGKWLAAVAVLPRLGEPLTRPCRDAWRVAASFLEVPWS